MEMKKIVLALLFVAATLSAVMAAGPEVVPAGGATPVIPVKGVAADAPAPSATLTAGEAVLATGVPAPAPGPSSGAAELGSLFGATLLSFLAYYMQ